jgi:L-ascorbate metabolism protein UlaG (beta-lactamase superfamily)
MTAQVTWIGHASALVALGKERFLIDPLGRRRCSAVSEYSTILITHSHIDHLNRWTLSRLDRGAHLIVPKGAARYTADLGFARVSEVEPGDQLAIGHVDLVCVPTRHDNGRWRRGDAPICTGYVLAGAGSQIHHAGDVDMSSYDVFDEIGRQFRIDVSLLPIGGLLPVWYYRARRNSLDRGVHIDPDTALAVAERLGAATMIPVHWGTVNLRLGRVSEPRRRLEMVARAQGKSELIRVLSHGEALSLKGGDST